MSDFQSASLTWAFSATLFLVVGLAGAWICRRRAAVSHIILLLSLLMVLALPILSWGVRHAGIGVLPPAPVLSAVTLGSEAPTSNTLERPSLIGRTDAAGVAARSTPTVSRPRNPAAPTASPGERFASRQSVSSMFSTRLLPWLLWGALSIVVFARLARGIVTGVRLRRDSTACGDPELAAALRAARHAVGFDGPVELRHSDRVSCPVIWCWRTPCVLVPSRTPPGVDWRAVMVHELAHLVRKDHLSALVAEVVCGLLPWHPLAWAARRRMAVAAEQACDDWAVRHASSEAEYAGSLVAFAATCRGRGGFAMAPAIISTSGVASRVTRVLAGRGGAFRLGRAAAMVVTLTAIAAVAAAALSQPAPTPPPIPASQPQPAANAPNSISAFVDHWRRTADAPERNELWQRAQELAKINDPRIIPAMIGVIDADNTYDTVYGVGYFGLTGITGVEYSPFHDGPWWRRWWEANKQRFPDAAAQPIADLPRSAAGKTYTAFPEDLDTFDGKIRWLLKEYERLREGKLPTLGLSAIAAELAKHKDPRAIPILIGVIDADNGYDTVYGVGYFGLTPLVGVPYSSFHDGAWWRRWWETNKAKFPGVQNIPVPDLPKTKHGAGYSPFPADLDTFDGLVRELGESLGKPQESELALSEFADAFVRLKDPRAIPVLIGAIDADNSYYTIYGLGYFGLREFTEVAYSPYHDGAWWRRWWDANKDKFPPHAQAMPIPDFPKTARGRAYTPMPASFDTLDGKMAWLRESLASGRDIDFGDYSKALAAHKDPSAIPFLIGLIEAAGDERARYGISDGLGELARVRYDASHDGAWWRRWWAEHKHEHPAAKDTPVPDMRALFAAWATGEKAREQARIDAEFEGFPCQDLRAGGDDRKRYFLLGPAQSRKMPEKGWRLLLILPGGDGSADFQPFCRAIHRDALPEGFVAAELVAPAWSDNPNRTVWPTRMLHGDKAPFTTEDFIRAVADDVSARVNIDRSQILALGWSSSGPALYCDSLQPDTPVTGWFIAMSVFRPPWMPDLAAAKGRRYYILHSPGDTMIPIDQHARTAEKRLRESGAAVTLAEYAGGHGWTDDPKGHIRRGVEWLLTDKR